MPRRPLGRHDPYALYTRPGAADVAHWVECAAKDVFEDEPARAMLARVGLISSPLSGQALMDALAAEARVWREALGKE